MKNENGFTLVEIIAVILILGILGTIGVIATARYMTWSQNKAYETMQKAVYEAGINCLTEGGCQANGDAISTATLQNYGYLETLKNPKSHNGNCSGSITFSVIDDGTSSSYNSYNYTITLDCANIPDKYKVKTGSAFKNQ